MEPRSSIRILPEPRRPTWAATGRDVLERALSDAAMDARLDIPPKRWCAFCEAAYTALRRHEIPAEVDDAV